MLIFVLFVEVVYGIALPHVPRTASAAAASTLAAVPSSITAPPTIPTQWVLVPTTIEWPCALITDCYTPPDDGFSAGYTGPATANWFGDWHTDQASWLVDPYQRVAPQGSDYTYDSTCGLIWISSLKNWIATASTTLGPLIPASDVYTTVTATTTVGLSRTQNITDISGSQGHSVFIGTNYNGSSTTITYMVETDSESVVWASTTRWTSTITGYTSLLSTASAHQDTYFVSPFSFVAASPCCSSCTLFGGTVQVYDWPTPAPQPPVSILVDPKNNFTFTSPSIYVAFQSLYATNLCGSLEAELITSTTIAFSAGELSTSQIYTVDGKVTDYMDFFAGGYTVGEWTQTDCTPTTSTIYEIVGVTQPNLAAASQYLSTNTEWFVTNEIDTISLHTYTGPLLSSFTVINNPCSPALLVPTKLYTLQPLWTDCIAGLSAFFDPPRTLTSSGSQGFIAPPRTTHVQPLPEITPSTQLQPGGTPSRAVPTPTARGTQPSAKQDPAPSLPKPTAYIIANQRLSPGAPPITLNGHKCSLQPSGSSVVIDDTATVALASFLAAPLSAVGGVNPSGAASSGEGGGGGGGSGNSGVEIGYVFGSQTLMPGQEVTVSGEVMSLDSDGSSVVMVAASPTAGMGTSSNGGGGGSVGISSNNSGGGSGATETEGISALINGAQSSSSTRATQSSAKQTQTQNAAMRGVYTGHERLCWVGMVLVGFWVVGFALL